MFNSEVGDLLLYSLNRGKFSFSCFVGVTLASHYPELIIQLHVSRVHLASTRLMAIRNLEIGCDKHSTPLSHYHTKQSNAKKCRRGTQNLCEHVPLPAIMLTSAYRYGSNLHQRDSRSQLFGEREGNSYGGGRDTSPGYGYRPATPNTRYAAVLAQPI